MSEQTLSKNIHYITLELPYLPAEKYMALLKCTVDHSSQWIPEKRLNRYKIDVHKIREVEKILGWKITVKREIAGEVEGEIGKRERVSLDICYNIEQRILIVIENEQTHVVPFDYIEFIWKIIKDAETIKPRQIWEMLEDSLGLPRNTFYQYRKIYYEHYYWPVVALKGLGLIAQSGSGPLELTKKGKITESWESCLERKTPFISFVP
jgi:hypothetical protein